MVDIHHLEGIMGDVYSYDAGSSSTGSGGGTTYAPNYSVTQSGGSNWWDDPSNSIDKFTQQANAMNASRGGGGGGGGGGKAYNESYQQDPSGNLYNPLANHWIDSPGFGLQQQQQAFKQQQFGQVFGTLSGLLNQFGSSNPYTIGGVNGTAPEISVGGVYNPQQVDQQVAASRAKTDQSTASQQKQMSDEMAGRGYGINSPLIAAMQGNLAGQGIATNASNENQIRQTAAQQNAQQTLSTQTERENQYEAENSLAIQRAKPYFDRQNALIAALAGIV
jgi:hypothetical protein